MGWATPYLADLQDGRAVQFRPTGRSMSGKIEHGQLVTVAPILDPSRIKAGDVVLCKVNGSHKLHLVKAAKNGAFLIANNRGYENGWTRTIYGIVVDVKD